VQAGLHIVADETSLLLFDIFKAALNMPIEQKTNSFLTYFFSSLSAFSYLVLCVEKWLAQISTRQGFW
jgi:hypothetical protein